MLSHLYAVHFVISDTLTPVLTSCSLFLFLSNTGMLYSQGLSGYHMMSQHHNPYTTSPAVTESSLYTPPFTPIKMEYPCGPGSVSSCMQMPSSSYMVPLPPPPPTTACTSATGLSMPTTCTGHIVEPSAAYSTSISSTGRSLQDGHISEVCRVGWVEVLILRVLMHVPQAALTACSLWRCILSRD